jgi:hypothetical protein
MDKGKETVYKSKLGEKRVDKGKFDDFTEETLYPDLDSKPVVETAPEVHKQEAKVEERASPKPQQPVHHEPTE